MRITESQLRRIIREPISINPMSHSQGWIDPEGHYHYDPRLSDHGEWAMHKLLDLGMSEEMLDGIREEASRYIQRGDSELRMPDSDDVKEIHRSISWIVEDVAKDMLLRMGWGKVMNAYTIDVRLPSRTIIDRWLELGMDAGVDADDEFTVYSDDDILVSGDMEEIERFMKKLRR